MYPLPATYFVVCPVQHNDRGLQILGMAQLTGLRATTTIIDPRIMIISIALMRNNLFNEIRAS